MAVSTILCQSTVYVFINILTYKYSPRGGRHFGFKDHTQPGVQTLHFMMSRDRFTSYQLCLLRWRLPLTFEKQYVTMKYTPWPSLNPSVGAIWGHKVVIIDHDVIWKCFTHTVLNMNTLPCTDQNLQARLKFENDVMVDDFHGWWGAWRHQAWKVLRINCYVLTFISLFFSRRKFWKYWEKKNGASYSMFLFIYFFFWYVFSISVSLSLWQLCLYRYISASELCTYRHVSSMS